MRNLFILNGAIPMLVADSLMRTTLAGDENVVIVEKISVDFSRLSPSLADKKNGISDVDISRCEDLLAQTLPSAISLKCHHATQYPNFQRRPFTFLRESRQTVQRGLALKRQIGGRFDRLFYSGNAKLQYAMADCAPQRIRLEHGLGDYMYTKRRLFLSTRLRRLAVFLVTGFREFDPEQVYLTDGGKCRSISANIPGVCRISPPDVAAQFARLREVLEREEPDLNALLEDLCVQASKFRDVIIYMPLDRFPMEQYDKLLDAQLKQVQASGALFVVKPHPTDTVNYLSIFEARGLSALRVDHPVGRYLPVEFIATLLPTAKLMGVGSSALFYGKWWMGREIHYASVGIEDQIPIYRDIHAAFAADIAELAVS